MTKRFKVLIAAYACNPFKGSEEGVGWGWVQAISNYHDVWVITAEYHRTDIENAVSKSPDLFRNVSFNYVPHKPWHYKPEKKWLLIENSIMKPIMNYAYRLWQRDAYKLAIKLNKQHHFDLIHQLTYVGFRFPGYLWEMDVPFVWGPIGGLENTPWNFLISMGAYGCFYYLGRNIINSLHRALLCGPKRAFRKARGCIISATDTIRKEILRWYGEDSHVICEIGPPSVIASDFIERNRGDILRISWSGEHLPGKALPLLLKALTLLPSELNWKLDILGRGPYTGKWQRIAADLKIGERCTWHGFLSREQAIDIVHNSHLFVITSLKDLTSSVLLEALSQGVPVICPDHCGFSSVIKEDCGIKIPVESPDQLRYDMAAAIIRLADNEQERRRLALGALKRITDFSWERKAEVINSLYQRIMIR